MMNDLGGIFNESDKSMKMNDELMNDELMNDEL